MVNVFNIGESGWMGVCGWGCVLVGRRNTIWYICPPWPPPLTTNTYVCGHLPSSTSSYPLEYGSYCTLSYMNNVATIEWKGQRRQHAVRAQVLICRFLKLKTDSSSLSWANLLKLGVNRRTDISFSQQYTVFIFSASFVFAFTSPLCTLCSPAPDSVWAAGPAGARLRRVRIYTYTHTCVCLCVYGCIRPRVSRCVYVWRKCMLYLHAVCAAYILNVYLYMCHVTDLGGWSWCTPRVSPRM